MSTEQDGGSLIERLVSGSVAARGTVLGVVIVLALAAMGIGRSLRFDALPDITGVQVVVLTRAPGLTPEEIEQLVTRPIESALGGIPHLVSQRSLSRYGLCAVTAVFDDDADLYLARQLVTERLAQVAGSLPEAAEAPELGPISGGIGEVFHFRLASPRRTPAELLELATLRVAPLLRTAPGVVEVNTWGGSRRTLDVVGDPLRMARHGVTLDALREATARSVGTAAGASVPAGVGHTLLRGVALPERHADLAEAVVRADEHGVVRITDVAEVIDGQEPRVGAATSGGRGETVYLMAQMAIGANAIEVVSGLHERLESARATLPEDVELVVFYDRTNLVGATLRTVGSNLLEGGLLVVLVLFLMLGNLRAGLLVAAVIPLSMLGAVVGMVALGIPGNLMSLGALDFGLLVDGAVVVVEAVFHHFTAHPDEPGTPRERIARVARGVARPVFFSVLVILLVYVPILALRGVEGKMFAPMAATVVLALASSLVLALTFVPAVASWVLGPAQVPKREPFLVRWSSRLYAPLLDAAIRRPMLIAALSLIALAVGAGLYVRAGTAFVPTLDEGDLVIMTQRAPDTSLETAVEESQRMERIALATAPEVLQAVTRIGSPAVATDLMGIEQADLFLSLRPRADWRPGLTQEQLIAELVSALEAGAPGATLAVTQPIQMRNNELLGGSTDDVSVSLFGEDLDALRAQAERTARVIESVEGAVDVRVASPPGTSLIEVRPRPLDASRVGMDAASVMDVVRALRVGVPAGATYDGPVRVPIRVRLGLEHGATSVGDAMIPTPDGELVALARIADVVSTEAPSLVSHDDASRRVIVGFNVRGRDLGSVVEEARARIDAEAPPPAGIRAAWGGQFESLGRARDRLMVVVPLVLVGILLLLFRAFDGWRHALVVFLNVPFAAVGGIVALTIAQLPISISAAIGFIALSGIAVLNGVVLMSEVQRNEREGRGPVYATSAAAKARLRPVLTTALVASLGFVPMMLAHGVGAEVQRPLATVVVGGLVSSTLLTLVVLPTIYPWIAARKRG